jgi:hypothetical protein
MKLAMLPIVGRTALALQKLEEDIAAVEMDLCGVVIADRWQDQAMAAICRPFILTELKARKASLLRDLESYGVKVD